MCTLPPRNHSVNTQCRIPLPRCPTVHCMESDLIAGILSSLPQAFPSRSRAILLPPWPSSVGTIYRLGCFVRSPPIVSVSYQQLDRLLLSSQSMNELLARVNKNSCKTTFSSVTSCAVIVASFYACGYGMFTCCFVDACGRCRFLRTLWTPTSRRHRLSTPLPKSSGIL